MTPHSLPHEKSFPTGSHGAILVLMVCSDWVWAGLYASPYSFAPAEVAASARLQVTAGGKTLTVGGQSFAVSPASLWSVRRWLDRNGVRVRTRAGTESSAACSLARSGAHHTKTARKDG